MVSLGRVVVAGVDQVFSQSEVPEVIGIAGKQPPATHFGMCADPEIAQHMFPLPSPPAVGRMRP